MSKPKKRVRKPAARSSAPAYAEAYKNLLSAFNCPQFYLVNPNLDSDWGISDNDGLFLLTVDGRRLAVVLQSGQPLAYRANGYALVIAIDCVKTGFLLDERRELK